TRGGKWPRLTVKRPALPAHAPKKNPAEAGSSVAGGGGGGRLKQILHMNRFVLIELCRVFVAAELDKPRLGKPAHPSNVHRVALGNRHGIVRGHASFGTEFEG